MTSQCINSNLDTMRQLYPEKFAPEARIFKQIRRGDTLFVGTGCGEPQYLVQALLNYVRCYPTAFVDTEVFQVWTLGVAPYADEKFRDNFRHNSFFIAKNTREAVNTGLADYTPIFSSQIPELLDQKLINFDVALIQTSLPDRRGYLNLGISVDITKAAVENANLVIAQINAHMPRVPGDGFIHIKDVDFVVPYDEPLLEYRSQADDEVTCRIGRYVSSLIRDGDTIQIGYGSVPDAILANLGDKQHLGVHTELLTDGLIPLLEQGVIDNSKKKLNRGRTIATFCMGTQATYDYLDDNPTIEFRTVDYTNNPLVIAQEDNMAAINSALAIDLTGQATAESLGPIFYSGIGGQADFMRGAVLARSGKAILALPSTAENGTLSRIVPFLSERSGVTLNRGDIHYVVTEYGIAYLRGKNIRERAMELIAIAHPKFRPRLIEEARQSKLIYSDQAFISGKRGEYPEEFETYRTTKKGLEIFLRPVKICDEPLLKEFFYSLSDASLYRRFFGTLRGLSHERLQQFVVIDYSVAMAILALVRAAEEKEYIVGIGQYYLDEATRLAELSFAVRDTYQNMGIGTELLAYLTYLAKRRGLLGFTAEVLTDNKPMLHLFDKTDFDTKQYVEGGVCELIMTFN